MKVAVIGGGPSGLVTLKYLLTAHQPIEARLFEKETTIGGTFRHRSYENAELVSSKQLTTFSDFRLPLDHPDHMSLEEYVAYLERYADAFELHPHMTLGCAVTSLKRNAEGTGHVVTYSDSEGHLYQWECDAVAICSGLHVFPNIPKIPGMENVKGRILHSSEYKKRQEFAGKKVLVVGAGETAMDLSYESVQVAQEVSLSHRHGFLSFPKVLNGFSILGNVYEGNIPIDGLISNLFENSYVHWIVKESRLRWHVSDFFVKIVLRVLTGTSSGCSQYCGELPSNRTGRAYVFLNKSTKAMPYINAPFKQLPWWHRLISYYEPPTNGKVIHLRPEISHFDEDGAVYFVDNPSSPEGRKTSQEYRDGYRFKPDVVALATGYMQKFPFMEQVGPWPAYPDLAEANVRKMWRQGDESVAFIGFVRPGVGAIPPLAEVQAQHFTLSILGLLPPLVDPHTTHYSLLHRSALHAVDYSAYLYQLSSDIGSAPSPIELFRRFPWRVGMAYCLGAAFTPTFRLVGPWRDPMAPQVVEQEIWETVTRRGIGGNLMMAIIPIIFYGLVNSILWLGEGIKKAEKYLDHLGRPVTIIIEYTIC
ncbi:dimethylaniline monooxygenase [Phlyctochytrium arcticum]|nr:dimethylaniline monooxygenase [Phlyctochytrium arcticum]